MLYMLLLYTTGKSTTGESNGTFTFDNGRPSKVKVKANQILVA